MNLEDFITKEQLKEYYINQNMSDKEIAVKIGWDSNKIHSIKKLRKKYKIQRENKLLTPEDLKKLITEGKSPKEIANLYGKSEKTVKEKLRILKIDWNSNKPIHFSEEELNKIKSLFYRGYTDKEIAVRLGLSESKYYSIRHARLEKLNLKKRDNQLLCREKLKKYIDSGKTRQEIADLESVSIHTVNAACQKEGYHIKRDIENVTEEIIKEYYLDKGNTDQEIAEMLGIKHNRVWEKRKLHLGVERTFNFQKKNLEDEVTLERKNLILGVMLGDGSIYKNGNYYSFSVSHSEKQHGYIDRLAEKLGPLTRSVQIQNSMKQLDLYSHPFIEECYGLFYPLETGYKRTLFPDKLIEEALLNLEVLSYWIFDNGYLDGNTICIGTIFDFKERHKFIKYLYESLGLISSISEKELKSGKIFKIIRIYPNSQLIDHLKKLSPRCLEYKIPSKPSELYQHKHQIQNYTEDSILVIKKCPLTKEEFIVPYQSPQIYKENPNLNISLANDTDKIVEKLHQIGFPYLTYQEDKFLKINYNIKTNPIKSQSDNLTHSTYGFELLNYFMKNRYKYTSRDNPFTAEEWFYKTEKLTQLIDRLKECGKKSIKVNQLRTELTQRGETPGNFSPKVAKYLYDNYSSSGSTILDLCSGWGGRLLGYWCSKKPIFYIGVEPNTETFNNLTKLYNWLKEKDPLKKEVEIYNSPLEDLDYNPYKNKVDLIFTSPPYFDREKYGTEDTQSYLRYPTYAEWKDKFLSKFPEVAEQTLKEKGYLIINLKNTSEFNIYDDLKELAKNFPLTLVKEYKLKMGNQRYSSNISYEMIGVWQKN